MKSKNGFTLIEMLFYLALISFLSFAVFSVLNIVNKERINSLSFSEVNYQGILISNLIAREVRGAKSAVIEGGNKLIIYKDQQEPVIVTFSGGDVLFEEKDKDIEKLNNFKVAISSFMLEDSTVSDESNSISLSFIVSYNNKLDVSDYNYSKKFYVSASTHQEK